MPVSMHSGGRLTDSTGTGAGFEDTKGTTADGTHDSASDGRAVGRAVGAAVSSAVGLALTACCVMTESIDGAYVC